MTTTTLAAPRCRASTAASRLKAVERAVEAMHARLHQPLTLKEMARAAHSSPYHFNRFFRQVTGLPPCRFLAAVRLEAAKRLLLTTRHSVTRVCFEVGYSSVGSFTRHFALDVGMPPLRLRRFPEAAPPLPDDPAAAEPRPAPAGEGVHGVVEAPAGFGGPVFVGLFPEPIPRGQPVACTVLAGPGAFRLAPVPDGVWHVLAAGLGGAPEPRALLHDDALRASAPVSVVGGRAESLAALWLRERLAVDPPILAPLPVLLAGRASEQGRRSAAAPGR